MVHKSTDLLRCLTVTERDVIVREAINGSTKGAVVSQVSTELLLITLLRNLQRNIVTKDPNQSVDLVKYYRRVTSNLRAGAIRRPKRRMFLEIPALEEELDSLRAIFEIQVRMLRAYEKVLDPDYSQRGSTDQTYLQCRRIAYPLEKDLVEEQRLDLEGRGNTLLVLQGIAQITRHDMKQILEVLDEGHGKAIRSLTFVTLFFLPL